MKFRKKQPAVVRIMLHAMKPEPAEPKYDGHMELEDKKKLFGLKPEPAKEAELRKVITPEDAKEIVPLMEAIAMTLREFCAERNLDYNTIAQDTFELMAESPEIWGCL